MGFFLSSEKTIGRSQMSENRIIHIGEVWAIIKKQRHHGQDKKKNSHQTLTKNFLEIVGYIGSRLAPELKIKKTFFVFDGKKNQV